MPTTVINIRRQPDLVDTVHYHYIGRGSKWGNRATHLNLVQTGAEIKVASREDAIGWYVYNFPSRLLDAVLTGELDDAVLGCFCKPKHCHGDFLAWLANLPRELLRSLDPAEIPEWYYRFK